MVAGKSLSEKANIAVRDSLSLICLRIPGEIGSRFGGGGGRGGSGDGCRIGNRRRRGLTYGCRGRSPLTEKQKEIVDYSDGHGLEEAEARFGISHNQVRYLREKRNRIEREKNPGNSEAVQPAMAFARVECGERTIEVRIGTVAMTITASDLAEVMRRL
jgi:CRISPR/Cas system CSM-associated protein Csm2 small subunit